MVDVNNYDKKIFKIKKGILKKYRGTDSEVEIPQGVHTIKSGAFKENNKIVSVVIPFGVRYIGEEAFDDCRKLESVSLPTGLLTIGSEAFDGCRNIKHIVIPRSVEHIASEAFEEFSKDQTITIEGGESQAKNFSRRWNSGCRAQIIYK